MQVAFIGGPLDGELREVPSACIRTPAQRGRGPATFTITNLTLVPPEYVDYDIANGIARHESVGEEEVGRRVHRLLVDRRTNNGHDGLPCTCTIACKTACKGECGCDACRNAYCDAIEE